MKNTKCAKVHSHTKFVRKHQVYRGGGGESQASFSLYPGNKADNKTFGTWYLPEKDAHEPLPSRHISPPFRSEEGND